MAKYRVADVTAIQRALRIEVEPSPGGNGTSIYVKPPFDEQEYHDLCAAQPYDSKLQMLLSAAGEKREKWLRFDTDGTTSTEHLTLGIELAEAIIGLKGLEGAFVIADIDRELQTRLVLPQA